MRRHKFLTKTLLSVSILLAGGTVLSNGCINTLASLPICGGILTFCTPSDQLNLLYPMLEIPDFNADPSCTIPLGCGGRGSSDLFGPVDPNNPDAGPGGGASDPPSDATGGGLGGGGGGGV